MCDEYGRLSVRILWEDMMSTAVLHPVRVMCTAFTTKKESIFP